MNKKKLFTLLSLISIVSLVSCSTENRSPITSNLTTSVPNSSSNNTSGSQSTTPSKETSATSSAPEEKTLSKEDLFNALSEMADMPDYQIDFSIDNQPDSLFVTSNYFYREKTNNGKILLKDYSSTYPSLFYFMNLNGEKVEVSGAYTYTDQFGKTQAYSDIKDIEYFSLMTSEKYKVTKDDFEEVDDGVSSDSDNLLNILVGGSLGLQENYKNYSSVYFSYDEDENIQFQLYRNGQFDSSISGTIKNIGDTHQSVIDKYLTSLDGKVPQEKISENLISNLKSPNLSLTHTINEVNETTGKVTKIGTVKEDYDATHLSLQDELEADKSTSKTVFLKTQKEGEVALASNRLVTAWNEIGNSTTETWWDDLFFLNSDLPFEDFRKISDNTYEYFGPTSEAIAAGITYFNGSLLYPRILLDVKDNKAFSFSITSTQLVNSQTGDLIHYDIQTQIESTPRAITDPDVFKEDTAMKTDWQKALTHLADKTIQYKIVLPKNLNGEDRTIYYSPSVVYYETKTTRQDSAESDPYIVTTGKGYALKNGKEIPFDVDKDGNVKASATGENATDLKKRYFDWKLSYNVLKKNKDNTYSFKPNVIDIDQAIPTGDNFSYATYDSIKLSLDSNQYLSNISYDYKDSTGNISGSETLSIKYDNDAALPSKVSEGVKNLEEAAAKTNWAEDMPSLYDQMTNASYFGFNKEDVDALPYIYIKEISGHWHYFYSEGVLTLNSYQFMGDSKSTTYAQEFKAKFDADKSWSVKELDGVRYYIHGQLKVQLGDTLDTLMKISKYEG